MPLAPAIRQVVTGAESGGDIPIGIYDDLEVSVFENDPDSWMAEIVAVNPVSAERNVVWRSTVRNRPPLTTFNEALVVLRRIEDQRRAP